MADKKFKTTVSRKGGKVRVTLETPTHTIIYQVENNGQVIDRSGARIDRSDVLIVLTHLRSNGYNALADKVTVWWDKQ